MQNTGQSVKHWKQFFRDHKTYFKVGRVNHQPIDPASPLPVHCDPKKDAGQNARWGVAPAGDPGTQGKDATAGVGANVNAAEIQPEDADAKSGQKKAHQEL
jgi:hypothetical protein